MAERMKVGAKKAARAGAGVAAAPVPVPVLLPLRPSQCRAYMRRELAREFREIVQGFVEGAKKGSCQHVKLATELVGTPERRRRRGKGAVRALIEEFEAAKGGGCEDL